ncbi:hypothetical protein [Methylocella silvestris]|uniref:hypothetical protein n=1 Tax=Methylocella silvestris TaxID=199596 RepID=UPI0015E0C75A|nr:hypothetical protein [Methylocella silvestris]
MIFSFPRDAAPIDAKLYVEFIPAARWPHMLNGLEFSDGAKAPHEIEMTAWKATL